jgi:hypothetical protein
MNWRLLLAGLLALPLSSIAAAQSTQPPTAYLWLTTANRSALLEPQSAPIRFTATSTALRTITVNDMEQYQSMDGFGFAVTGGSAELLMRMSTSGRAALLREIFSPTGDGIHVSYIRVSIGSSDMNDRPYTYDDMRPGETDPQLRRFSVAVDRDAVIPVLKQILAINPHIKILGSPWSAPAWMKTNDNLKGGELKAEDYPVYAQYFVKYIQEMQGEGIHLAAITVQNEPLNPKNTPSMAMFASEEDRFIAGDLGPAFARAGIHTGIQVYDHNPDVPSYPLSILADPGANKYLEGTAFHLYGGSAGTFTKVHNLYPRKGLFMTEQFDYGEARIPDAGHCRGGGSGADWLHAQLEPERSAVEPGRRCRGGPAYEQRWMRRVLGGSDAGRRSRHAKPGVVCAGALLRICAAGIDPHRDQQSGTARQRSVPDAGGEGRSRGLQHGQFPLYLRDCVPRQDGRNESPRGVGWHLCLVVGDRIFGIYGGCGLVCSVPRPGFWWWPPPRASLAIRRRRSGRTYSFFAPPCPALPSRGRSIAFMPSSSTANSGPAVMRFCSCPGVITSTCPPALTPRQLAWALRRTTRWTGSNWNMVFVGDRNPSDVAERTAWNPRLGQGGHPPPRSDRLLSAPVARGEHRPADCVRRPGRSPSH